MTDSLALGFLKGVGSRKQITPTTSRRLVDAHTHGVPNLGYFLPLIDKVRGLSQESQRNVLFHGKAGRTINETNHARCDRQGTPCLAAPLGPDNLDGTKRLQEHSQAIINKTAAISLGAQSRELGRHGGSFVELAAYEEYTLFEMKFTPCFE